MGFVFLENDYKIFIPRDAEQLEHVGDKMNICIGSYYNKVCLGSLIFILCKKDRYFMATEVVNKRVNEIKLCNNKIPEQNEIYLIQEILKISGTIQ